MGGGSSAFEDDPVSVWCNPAGMATQQTGVGLEFQTFTEYRQNDRSDPPTHFSATVGLNDPAPLPSFVGAVYQVGTVERPQAIGLTFVTPILLHMAWHEPSVNTDTWKTSQRFSRFRLAYARDFKFRTVGEEGFFPHLSIGLGMDLGTTTLRMEDPTIDQDRRKSKTEFGAGFGFLLCAFDNTRTLKVNLAASYQTSVAFDLALPNVPSLDFPALNWPNQVQLGALVYLLEGLPLRLSAEIQFVDWKNAGLPSAVAGTERFTRTTVSSVGAEYRVALPESMVLYPRLGIRFYDAPWSSCDKARLPATGNWQLRITTSAERFTVFCFGFGLSFLGEGGGATTVNISVEFGADAPAASLGVVVVF